MTLDEQSERLIVEQRQVVLGAAVSIHNMHGPVGMPFASTGTMLMYWLVTVTATIGGVGLAAAIVARVASTIAVHIS